MSNSYLEQHRDFFGDDIYINDPVLKKHESLKFSDTKGEETQEIIPDEIKTENSNKIESQDLNIEEKVAEFTKQVIAPFDQKNTNPGETSQLANPQEKQHTTSKNQITVSNMQSFYEEIKSCTKCTLCESRNSFVFAKGNDQSDILIIGEAPGAEEDRQGIPFVGRAGQLLDKILAAVQLDITNVFITNIVKCRPPNNRDPEPNEIYSCSSYLDKQIELLQPKMILALGRVSGRTLLGQELSLSSMRGTFHEYMGIPLMITYHPSALLRNEAWKRPTWEDMKLFKQKYSELKGTK